MINRERENGRERGGREKEKNEGHSDLRAAADESVANNMKI